MNELIDPSVSDKILIQTIGATISKMTLFICSAVVMGMMINSCQVDEAVIVQCEESCGIANGMKEVTGTSCECNRPKEIIEAPFVL